MKRNSSFDILRILAAFSVVMLHSSAQFWYDLPVSSMEWKIANAYDACVRIGVPMFVMISGALFLTGENRPSPKKMFLHNALRMMIVYLLWNALYGLLDCYWFGFPTLTAKDILKEMLGGRYHLWFLPMIAGIYVLCPLLYDMVHAWSKETMEYFVGLFLGFQVLRSTLMAFITNPYLQHYLEVVELPMICSYVGYFILGYYLVTYPLSGKIITILRIGVIPGLAFNILVSTWQSMRRGMPIGSIYDSFCIGTFVFLVWIFVEGTNHFNKVSTGKASRLLEEISKSTFGAYLMHVGVQEFLETKGIHSMMLPIGIGIPVWALCNFLLCLVIATVLRKIPLIGRYIC